MSLRRFGGRDRADRPACDVALCERWAVSRADRPVCDLRACVNLFFFARAGNLSTAATLVAAATHKLGPYFCKKVDRVEVKVLVQS